MGVGIVVMFILLSSYGTRVGSAITLSHSLRAVCLCLVEFPTPAMAIWRKPGFPSEGANDYFFSGHMSIPMIAAMEMSRRGYHSLALFVHLANAGQFLCMVILRWHWTADLITGLLSGYACFHLINESSRAVDRGVARAMIFIKAITCLGERKFDDVAIEKVLSPSLEERDAWIASLSFAMISLVVLLASGAF